MIYRNTKTGAEISTPCKVSGGDWVEVLPPAAEKPKEEPKPKKAAKNGRK